MLDDILRRLLEKLETIGDEHDELFDSDVRERMSAAIMEGFVRGRRDNQIPDDMGMFSEDANAAVRSAIQDYVGQANAAAANIGLTKFHDRLAAYQNGEVRTQRDKNDFDEFFGTTPPEFYDKQGVAIRLM